METMQTTIRLGAELKEKLQHKADRLGYPLKNLIIFILRHHLQNIFQE